jgi:hypothetical protein
MQGAKLDNLKAATCQVIERLNPNDIASIVIFDDNVQTLVPATPVGDRSQFIAAVNTISEARGTAMSLWMQARSC